MMRGAKRDKLDPALDTFDVETARELILPVALALDYLHHKARRAVPCRVVSCLALRGSVRFGLVAY